MDVMRRMFRSYNVMKYKTSFTLFCVYIMCFLKIYKAECILVKFVLVNWLDLTAQKDKDNRSKTCLCNRCGYES